MIPYLSHPCFPPLLLPPPPPDLGKLSVGGNNLSKPKNQRRHFINTFYFIMPENLIRFVIRFIHRIILCCTSISFSLYAKSSAICFCSPLT